jgi:hypothetical protein
MGAGGHLAEMAEKTYSTVPNLNTGAPWSDLALADLKHGVAHGDTIGRIADFLCRSEVEVADKIHELGLK